MVAARSRIDVEGLGLAWAEVGEGPPVVHLHGALMTAEEGLIGLGPTLAPRRRLIAFDRPGHGGSDRDLTTGSPWRQAALIGRALDLTGVQRPVVVGHSFGGAVAVAMALQRPERLAGVVALAPIVMPEPRLEHLLFGWRAAPGAGEAASAMTEPLDRLLLPALWSGMFAPQTMTPAFSAGFPFQLSARRAAMTSNGQEALATPPDLMRSLALMATCRVPIRVLVGERDAVVNPAHGRLLAMSVPGATLRSLPGLGHMAHHFAPEAVAEAVEELSPGPA